VANEEIDAASVFINAREAADTARAALIHRLSVLEVERAEIKKLLGRKPRTPKAPKKATE